MKEKVTIVLALIAIVISCVGIGFQLGVNYSEKHSDKREALLFEYINKKAYSNQ